MASLVRKEGLHQAERENYLLQQVGEGWGERGMDSTSCIRGGRILHEWMVMKCCEAA